MSSILLAIGSPLLRSLCADALRDRGYAVVSLETPLAAISAAGELRWAAAILDATEFGRASLPAISLAADAPIIGIGWQSAQLTKSLKLPLTVEDLVALLASVLTQPLETVHLRLDRARRIAALGDIEVSLTPTEFRLLEKLEARRPEVLTQPELLASVWGTTEGVDGSEMVRSHVRNLRRKLRRLGLEDAVQSRRGGGYYLQP